MTSAVVSSRCQDPGQAARMQEAHCSRVPTIFKVERCVSCGLSASANSDLVITDSHGHTLEYGASRLLLLEGSESGSGQIAPSCLTGHLLIHSLTAAVARVRDYILSHPAVLNDRSSLIEGWGWDHTAWPVEKFPSYVNHNMSCSLPLLKMLSERHRSRAYSPGEAGSPSEQRWSRTMGLRGYSSANAPVT